MKFSAKPGFALPAVLFIAVLGILVGFGRLLMFDRQCRLRIDRQHEFEKVFAVRSALNYLQNWQSLNLISLPEEGGGDARIVFHTSSGRDVKALVHPADAIFPVMDNVNHFCVLRETTAKNGEPNLPFSRIGGRYRYASSVSGDTTLKYLQKFKDTATEILVMPTNAVAGDICRLSLDMSETGRWSDDPFGRRYSFSIANAASIQGTNDTVRFILRRKRVNEIFNVHQSSEIPKATPISKTDRMWKPEGDSESVIFAELRNGRFRAVTQHGSEPERDLSDYPAIVNVQNGDEAAEDSNQSTFGIQLVGRNLTLFQATSRKGLFKQYNFFGTEQIPSDVYEDFTNNDVVATHLLPELVMELEVEACQARDGMLDKGDASEESRQNQFNKFEVFPAFEFEISVVNLNEGADPEPRLATVVHLDIDDSRSSAKCTAITYDTHGTEISGWRTDERKAWGVIR